MKPGLLGWLVLSTVTLTQQQATEIRWVEDRLLAPCCYTQPVSQHMSEVARQMRADITAMVADGQNEEQIVEHYKAEYGERILVTPDGRIGTALFRTPETLFLLALIPSFLIIRKSLRSGRASASSPVSGISPERYEVFRKEIEGATTDTDG